MSGWTKFYAGIGLAFVVLLCWWDRSTAPFFAAAIGWATSGVVLTDSTRQR